MVRALPEAVFEFMELDWSDIEPFHITLADQSLAPATLKPWLAKWTHLPNLVPEGWLVADNFLSHAKELRPVLARAQADIRVDALVVPIGKGLLLCRKIC